MKSTSVIDALPHIFRRPLQTIEAGASIFAAGTLLDIPRRDVFAIASALGPDVRLFSQNRRLRAFSGYGLLGALVRTPAKGYYRFLFERCERASLPLPCIDAGSSLSRVFEVMSKTRIGWLLARRDVEYAMVTLADLLPLYERGVLATDLLLKDVSTDKVFTLAAGARLDDALRGLIERRVRRVFLSGTRKFVSDREIMEHIFSPERLRVVRESPEKMLESPLWRVGPASAAKASPGLGVAEMATALDATSGAHCVLAGSGLVTPWDLIMKPWTMGRLKIAKAPAPTPRRGAN